MTDYRISQDQWKAHDIKKLIGLLALLIAAAIAYFMSNSEVPTANVDVPAVSTPEVNVPQGNTPTANMPEVNVPATNAPEVNAPAVTEPAPAENYKLTLESHTDGGKMTHGDTVFSGKAKPGTKVEVYVDKYWVADAIATPEGTWEARRFIHEGGDRMVYAKDIDTSEETPKIKVDTAKE
jgi:hypothetical protein